MKKKCKGTYRVNNFKGCGKITYIFRYGLCEVCFRSWCKSTTEGREWVVKNILPRAKKEIKKSDDVKFQKMKDNITDYKKPLQLVCQEICRLIDFGQLCTARSITCKKENGGHVYSKGGHSQCRFNLHNIHIQSEYSNTYKSDDGLMRKGIERIYGKEYGEFVDSLLAYPVPKFIDYKEAYKRACGFRNQIKRDKIINSEEDRIRLRNTANVVIGIYSKEQNIFKI